MFYTFKLLPQLKMGSSQLAYGDFFSKIAPWAEVCFPAGSRSAMFAFSSASFGCIVAW